MKTADAGKVVGYVRASTAEQRLGPEAQEAELRRYCEQRGLELVSVHRDLGVSGATSLEKRPGLLVAVDAVRESGAATLLVAKRDRLARDVVVCAMVERLLARSGARVASADGAGAGDGPEAMLMRSIVDAFAQYERALIRARTSAALQRKVARGEVPGGSPRIGQRVAPCGKLAEACPEEAGAVELAVRLHRSGHSLRAITRALDASPHRPRGRGWYVTTVQRMVARAA